MDNNIILNGWKRRQAAREMPVLFYWTFLLSFHILSSIVTSRYPAKFSNNIHSLGNHLCWVQNHNHKHHYHWSNSTFKLWTQLKSVDIWEVGLLFSGDSKWQIYQWRHATQFPKKDNYGLQGCLGSRRQLKSKDLVLARHSCKLRSSIWYWSCLLQSD